MQNYRGGNSAKKFLLRIRDQALEKCPKPSAPRLLALAEKVDRETESRLRHARASVRQELDDGDLEPALAQTNKGRDFAHGKKLFGELLCAQCHLFAGGGGLAKGGAVGPGPHARSAAATARTISSPRSSIRRRTSASNTRAILFTMKDGSMIGGQIAEENHYLVTLIVDPFNGTKQNIPKGNIVKKEASPVSLMPPG